MLYWSKFPKLTVKLSLQEGDVKAARDLYSQSLLMYPLRPEDPASAKEYSVILANRDWENSSIILFKTVLIAKP